MLDFGCVAVSHDEDWIGISEHVSFLLEQSHSQLMSLRIQFPERNELLRHVCAKFKFVAEGGKCAHDINLAYTNVSG